MMISCPEDRAIAKYVGSSPAIHKKWMLEMVKNKME